jgi:hypothetical protein
MMILRSGCGDVVWRTSRRMRCLVHNFLQRRERERERERERDDGELRTSLRHIQQLYKE